MRPACIVLLLAVVTSCTRDAPPPTRTDTPAPGIAPVDSAPPPVLALHWNPAAGPLLLVAGERPEEAIAVLPYAFGDTAPDTLDASGYVGSVATLLGRGGVVGTALLGDEDVESGATCNAWPVLSLPPRSAPWTVGFIGGEVAAYPLDSVQAMPRPDSAALVADIARLASGSRINLAGPHAEQFRGLPFVVYDARRFRHDSLEVLVAQIVRRVNQEASPLEEHTLMIAERPAGRAAWRIARVEWSVGHEESVRRQQLLAAVRVGTKPALVFTREEGSAVHHVIQWRGTGSWSTRWASPPSRC